MGLGLRKDEVGIKKGWKEEVMIEKVNSGEWRLLRIK